MIITKNTSFKKQKFDQIISNLLEIFMKNKSNTIRELSTIVANIDYSQVELEKLTQRVRDYQEKMKYVHERGLIKRNLAYTLELANKI